MKIVLTPIVQSLRDIYDIDGVMPRFRAYVSLFTGATRGEPLPIGVFSPMGKRQAAYLDALLAVGAEGIASEAASEAAAMLSDLKDRFRILLVVADVARNGWTERHLTDADWRFSEKYDTLPKAAPLSGFDRWVSVQLWTDEEPTEAYIRAETQSAIYRAAHRRYLGPAQTLEDMLIQEGRARSFAGYTPDLEAEDLAYSRTVIQPHLQSTDFATCFAALYGDEAARAVGYTPLGLTAHAGFDVGLADARDEGPPERWLLIAALGAAVKSSAPEHNAIHASGKSRVKR